MDLNKQDLDSDPLLSSSHFICPCES